MDEQLISGRKRKNSDDLDENIHTYNSEVKSLPFRKKPKPLGEDERQEEARLEKLVFGEASFLRLHNEDRLAESKDMEDLDSGLEADEELGSGEMDGAMDTMTTSEEKTGRRLSSDKCPRPAWIDDEDMTTSRGNAGTSEGNLLWARLNHTPRGRTSCRDGTSDSEDSDDEQSGSSDDDTDLLRHCGDLLQGKRAVASVHSGSRGGSLPSGIIRFRKVTPLNRDTHTEGPLISDVVFHPTSTVAAVAGVSGVASIVEVDGRMNSKLASVQFERFPIHRARFSTDGSELLVGSRHHFHFFSYDLMEGRTTKVHVNRAIRITNAKNFEVSPDGVHLALAGKWGEIHILSARAKEWITTFQMTGNVTSMCFSSDGLHLYTFGEAGEVWVWSMASRTCVHRFADEGSFGGSALAVSPSGRFIACGCPTGNVNLYDREEAFKPDVNGLGRPSPIYTVSNLVTSISSLRFDPTSELLYLASSDKADAARMLHLPSRSVFMNFPGRNSKMGRPLCVDISPHGGYLSVGSNKGTALLYRLSHFGNY